MAAAWRSSVVAAILVGSTLLGCGGSTPPPPPPVTTPDAGAEKEADDEVDASLDPTSAGADSPERSRPPSTASYDEAMSTPESLDVHDSRPHLNDDQLRGPMRNIMNGCPLPKNAKVTIRTAVQNGRAIGVSVDVRFDHPPPPSPPPGKKPKRPTRWELQRAKAEAEREAKAKKKISTCVDKAVRNVVWPPSSRRDSFTTDF